MKSYSLIRCKEPGDQYNFYLKNHPKNHDPQIEFVKNYKDATKFISDKKAKIFLIQNDSRIVADLKVSLIDIKEIFELKNNRNLI